MDQNEAKFFTKEHPMSLMNIYLSQNFNQWNYFFEKASPWLSVLSNSQIFNYGV
jgi:hypothetical protein